MNEICDICKSTRSQKVYCNQCTNTHYLCCKCIEQYEINFKIKSVNKSDIFEKNLKLWN